MGALFQFISSATAEHFQPMPPNFGILPPLAQPLRNKRQRYGQYRDRSLTDLHTWATAQALPLVPQTQPAIA
jgi:methylenetetrahydrofolate--tRNA-(uracil-5-)-methyltransferase